MQKVQEEIHNVNYENILIHLVASNMFVLISMFTKNWGRKRGIFDPNDFLKLFLNKMDFSKRLHAKKIKKSKVNFLEKANAKVHFL